MQRRDFLAAAAAAGAAALLPRPSLAGPFKSQIHKALIGTPNEKTLAAWKEAGFEGYESTNHGADPATAEAARKLAEKHGLRIHSVMFGWANFNKPANLEQDIKNVETSLRAAKAYGAYTILLVPCRIGGMAMPKPWEFDFRFDEKTGRLKQVVDGDNSRYEPYITAHNAANDVSREAVKRLIPTAEKTGVVIAIENVWNNLWVRPELLENLVSSFANPWIKAYFDIGNHVKYAAPELWIKKLGKLIAKCHIKDFKLNPNGHDGDWAHIRDGSVNWPVVRKALDEVGYNGWASIEESGLSLTEYNRRFDLIIAGE